MTQKEQENDKAGANDTTPPTQETESGPAVVGDGKKKKRNRNLALAALVIVVAILTIVFLPKILNPNPELPADAIEFDMTDYDLSSSIDQRYMREIKSADDIESSTVQQILSHCNTPQTGSPFGNGYSYSYETDNASLSTATDEKNVYHLSFVMEKSDIYKLDKTGGYKEHYQPYECDFYYFPQTADHYAVGNIKRGKEKVVKRDIREEEEDNDYEDDSIYSTPSTGTDSSGYGSGSYSGNSGSYSDSSSDKTERCPICGRPCTESEITWHGMCDSCYEDYKQASELMGKNID